MDFNFWDIDLEKIYTVTREELANNFEAIAERVKVNNPILIRSEGEHDLLMFDYDDYINNFGVLHPKEQIAEIEAACANYKES